MVSSLADLSGDSRAASSVVKSASTMADWLVVLKAGCLEHATAHSSVASKAAKLANLSADVWGLMQAAVRAFEMVEMWVGIQAAL